MHENKQSQRINEAVQDYLELGDAIRAAILPGWFVADLTISQLKAMMLVAYHGALSVSTLARLLSMGNPATSILVQQLVDQSFVERAEDARDRRRTLVRLTAQGAELIGGRHKQTETELRRWLGVMSEDEIASLARGLSALVSIVREEQAQKRQAAAQQP